MIQFFSKRAKGQKNALRTIVRFLSCAVVAFLFHGLFALAETKAPVYDKVGKRDPFIPYVTNDGQLINIGTEEKEFSLKLEGIIFEAGGNSYAIINGEVLKTNDTIGDVKIVEIRKDSVVYMKNGELFVVRREE